MSASRADQRGFVDTSAYYAAVDGRDVNHAVVAATMRDLIAARRRFVTANAVLFELHGLLLTAVCDRSVSPSPRARTPKNHLVPRERMRPPAEIPPSSE